MPPKKSTEEKRIARNATQRAWRNSIPKRSQLESNLSSRQTPFRVFVAPSTSSTSTEVPSKPVLLSSDSLTSRQRLRSHSPAKQQLVTPQLSQAQPSIEIDSLFYTIPTLTTSSSSSPASESAGSSAHRHRLRSYSPQKQQLSSPVVAKNDSNAGWQIQKKQWKPIFVHVPFEHVSYVLSPDSGTVS